jgi:hypothetical protein
MAQSRIVVNDQDFAAGGHHSFLWDPVFAGADMTDCAEIGNAEAVAVGRRTLLSIRGHR